MYAQLLPFPNHNLYTPPSNQHQRLVFYSKLKSGLLNSSRKVSLSRVSSRNSGQMTVIECSGLPTKQEHEQEANRDDGFYMRRCVELARTAIGCTSPNPMVGCVLVKNGEIVGEGFHPKAGQPHAEVFALRDAGELAENGTAYVSLEPCNHYGRTPPCTEALIKAKVRKVVVGMVDPNPIVDSTGVKKLKDAGIEVTVGVEEEMCKRLNEAFIHKMLTGNPFVTLRYTISLDGQLLNQPGEEAIESGGYYSKLLQEYDSIIVSSTSSADNLSSSIMSKEPGANQPHKILLSSNSPRMSFSEILEQCKRQGFCSVLLDLAAGDRDDFQDLLKESFEHNLLQKVVVEVLPVFSCGDGGRGKTLKMMDSLNAKVKNLTPIMHGGSVLLEGYFH